MNVEKIETKKISDSVVEQIERMIRSGQFQPGEKLPSVRELCEMFGVGRSAVRDAILTLKGKGAVDVKRGEGTYVRSFSSELFHVQMVSPELRDIRELFQVRKFLEPAIAETTANHCTDETIEDLEKYLNEKKLDRWEVDYNFHLAIVQGTNNRILLQLMEFISTAMKKTMRDLHLFIENKEEDKRIIDEHHQAIFDAIKKRNGKEAREKMSEHLEYVEKMMESSVLDRE